MQTQPQAANSGETLLVVEDEALIRMDISDYLRSHGYIVLEAPDANKAIEHLKTAPVSLVFTDVFMPGPMDGLALASYVQFHHPDVPVLITSGHLHKTELPSVWGTLIEKPYAYLRVLSEIQFRLQAAPRS